MIFSENSFYLKILIFLEFSLYIRCLDYQVDDREHEILLPLLFVLMIPCNLLLDTFDGVDFLAGIDLREEAKQAKSSFNDERLLEILYSNINIRIAHEMLARCLKCLIGIVFA